MIYVSQKWGHDGPPLPKLTYPQARENMNNGTFGHFSIMLRKMLHTPFEIHILKILLTWKYFNFQFYHELMKYLVFKIIHI